MVAIGGMGTISGPIVGAILLQVLPELIRFLSDYRQLMFGVALVISIMFAPRGIVGLNWGRIRPVAKLMAFFKNSRQYSDSDYPYEQIGRKKHIILKIIH